MEERVKLHHETLARLIRLTRTADAKAAPVLALQLALAGTLAARFNPLQNALTGADGTVQQVLVSTALALYVGSTVAAVVLAICVYTPRNPRTSKGILVYFEDIANMPRDQFIQRSTAMTLVDIEHQVLDQVHRVSEVVSEKMRQARRSLRFALVGSAVWLALLLYGSLVS